MLNDGARKLGWHNLRRSKIPNRTMLQVTGAKEASNRWGFPWQKPIPAMVEFTGENDPSCGHKNASYLLCFGTNGWCPAHSCRPAPVAREKPKIVPPAIRVEWRKFLPGDARPTKHNSEWGQRCGPSFKEEISEH